MTRGALLVAAGLILAAHAASATENWTFDVGGMERRALSDAPAANGTQHPLVIVLHGLDNTGADARRLGFQPVGAREGFVTVYPDGIAKRWNYGRPLNQPIPKVNGKDVDDIAFFNAIIERAVQDLNVDRKRVYLAGSSNGGLMAHRVACEMDRQIAAVASYITGMTNAQASSCKRSRAVPMLLIAGTADVYQTYAGTSGLPSGGYLLSVPNSVAIWQMRNGCKTFYEENLPDTEPQDATTVTLIRYDNCTDNADVLFYRINGGGHRTPTGVMAAPPPRPPFGRTNHDIDTAAVSWDFFKRFHLP